MKKIAIFLIMCMYMMVAYAQSEAESSVYCELVGSSNVFSSKVKVTVDFGQETSYWKRDTDQRLVDSEGKDIEFNSMVDAMNFMGKNGWKFIQAYTIGDSKNGYVYRWLLYKDIKDESEILEGFMTKEQYKATKQ